MKSIDKILEGLLDDDFATSMSINLFDEGYRLIQVDGNIPGAVECIFSGESNIGQRFPAVVLLLKSSMEINKANKDDWKNPDSWGWKELGCAGWKYNFKSGFNLPDHSNFALKGWRLGAIVQFLLATPDVVNLLQSLGLSITQKQPTRKKIIIRIDGYPPSSHPYIKFTFTK